MLHRTTSGCCEKEIGSSKAHIPQQCEHGETFNYTKQLSRGSGTKSSRGRGRGGGAMESIRLHYGVPAFRGRRVKFEGRPATITSAIRNTYLRLRFDGQSQTHHYVFHPLWEIDYLDGVDYDARFRKREQAFLAGLNRSAA
jgi:hypothetical protein